MPSGLHESYKNTQKTKNWKFGDIKMSKHTNNISNDADNNNSDESVTAPATISRPDTRFNDGWLKPTENGEFLTFGRSD